MRTKQEIAQDLLPCPFCGERLAVHEDEFGQWIAHRREPHPWCPAGTEQIHDERHAESWNTRAEPEEEEDLEDLLSFEP
jgi:hypothetical protein